MLPARAVAVASLLVLAGCANSGLEAVAPAPERNMSLGEVRANPAAARGASVRWGGQLVSVQNGAEETLVEIVSRRLDGAARPIDEDATEGRFIVKLKEFIDPAVFAAGREVTVRGQVEGVTSRPIGQFPYSYVLLKAERLYLWPPRLEPLPYPYWYYGPYWRDPRYPRVWPYRRY